MTIYEVTTPMTGLRDDMSGKSSRRGSRLLQSSPNIHDSVSLKFLDVAATDADGIVIVNHSPSVSN